MVYFLIYLGIFLASIFIAGLVFLVVSREPTLSWVKRFAGMQASGVNQASSALLVLCIAFLLNDVSQIRQKASETLLLEADILRTMGRVAVNLPRDVGEPLQNLLVAYSAAVLNEDWPRMQHGARDQTNAPAGSLPKIIGISDFVFSKLDQFGHPQISQQMLSSIHKLRELRLQRLELSLKHPTAEKVLLGLFFCLNAILVLMLTHADRPRPLFAAVLLFTWLSLSALYTVLNMHNPYAGIDPITPAPIAAASERLKVMARSSETVFTENPAPFAAFQRR
ncbi:MAG: hypothetical protein RLZZ57_23 [Pseudomonadota bacterium]